MQFWEFTKENFITFVQEALCFPLEINALTNDGLSNSYLELASVSFAGEF